MSEAQKRVALIVSWFSMAGMGSFIGWLLAFSFMTFGDWAIERAYWFPLIGFTSGFLLASLIWPSTKSITDVNGQG